MGLLDGNLDPQSMATMQLAAGLLSPGSFGQGLGKGLEGYQGTMANAQTMQLRQQQIAQAKQQMAMEQMQMQMLQRKQAFAENFMSPGPGPAPGTQAMGLGAANGSVGPTLANANTQNQLPPQAPTSRLNGLTEDQMFGGVMSGMLPKESVDLWKNSKYGMAMQPGWRLKSDGTKEYMGDPTKGITLDAAGNITKMGGSGAIADLAGETTAANEQAKNRNQLAPADRLVMGADGSSRPFGGTTADLLDALKGAPRAGASAPAPGNAHDYSQVSKGGGSAIDPTTTTGGTNGAPKSGATSAPAAPFKSSQVVNGNGGVLEPQPGDTPGGPLISQSRYTQASIAQDIKRTGAQTATVNGAPLETPYAQSGKVQLTSPAESAADTLRATQAVHAATDGVVEFNKTRLEKAHADVQAVYSKLGDTVRNEAELQNRNNQILPMLDKIQTGGFAPEQRIAFANSLQTAGWVPDALKGKFSQWVANGDPTTGKVIENQLAAAGIKTMLDTLDKEGKPNRAIFQAIQAAQESAKSGNATLKQVFGLQKQLYDWHYQQEQDLGSRISAPDYNPITTLQKFSSARNTSLQQTAPAATMRWNAQTGKIEKVQ